MLECIGPSIYHIHSAHLCMSAMFQMTVVLLHCCWSGLGTRVYPLGFETIKYTTRHVHSTAHQHAASSTHDGAVQLLQVDLDVCWLAFECVQSYAFMSSWLTAYGPDCSHALCLEMPAGAIAGRASLAHCPCALVPGSALLIALDLLRGQSQNWWIPCQSAEECLQ